MSLWLVKAIEGAEGNVWVGAYGTYRGFLIRHWSERDARRAVYDKLLLEGFMDEHCSPWLDPERSSCIDLTEGGDPGILLCDFIEE